MVAVTVLPMVAVPLFGGNDGGTISKVDLIWLIFFFARGHVALTVLFYFDRSFRALAAGHPGRFIVTPLVIVGVLPFLLMSNEVLFKASVFIVFGWNIWHFHKQNSGVLSLICISQSEAPPDRYMKSLAGLACAAGIAAFVPRQFSASFGESGAFVNPAAFDVFLFPTLLTVTALGSVATFAKWRFQNLPGQLFFFAIVGVYSIVFLFPGDIVYFAMAQATVHGLQYAILVYALGPTSGLGAPARTFGSTPRVIYACLIWGILLLWSLFVLKGGFAAAIVDDLLGTTAVLEWVQAFAVTALIAHFIIDGGAFKLRERAPRRWMHSRLAALIPAR